MGAPLVAAAGRSKPKRVSARSGCAVRLTLLNALELVCEGSRVTLPLSAQRLLAFVALKRHPVQRIYAAGSLWSNVSEHRAGASLRSALWRLRNSGHEILEADGQQLRLSGSVRVDLYEAETVAKRVLEQGHGTLLELDLTGLRGDLLPDWYDDWVLMEREYFRQLRLRALEVACDRLTDLGRLDAALSAGLAALECEPLRESAHRALVRVHVAQGNVSEAIRQYRLCRSLLLDHVGVEPSEQMNDLIRELATGRQLGDGMLRTIPGKGRAA
jgi:DNA-binding SARP family transcriptional activator